MNDLISRRAAIKAIDDLPNCYNGYSDTYDKAYIIGVLEELPTIESKRGMWIKATGMMPPEFHCHYCCSECGNFANMKPPFGNREDLSKFCPSCGARMDRSEECEKR